MKNSEKIIIYQVFTRLFGNDKTANVPNGTLEENGCGKMNDFTPKALKEIKELGCNHIWYTGIIEHATQTDYSEYGIKADHPAIVKGKAGSPYAIKDYYDVNPDLAVNVPNRMKEFEALVKRTHKAGLKIIIDFVPNHVARQYCSDCCPGGVNDLGAQDDKFHAFSPYNNFYYIPGTELHAAFDLKKDATEPYHELPAKATGNNRFDAFPNITDWYETVKLNYGVDYQNGGKCYFNPIPGTWEKMKEILLFWCSKGVDAFRCDMAEMVPVEFWEWVIPQVKEQYPQLIFIAEVYNPQEYYNFLFRGKFDYLYDKVGLYDTLRSVICGYESATSITRCWQQLNGMERRMLNFLENHDEQRIASDFFAANARKGIPGMLVSACINTNPVMIYSGQEIGEPGMDEEGFSGRDGRTTIFDYWSVRSLRQWRNEGKFDGALLNDEQKFLRETYKRILNICNEEKAITHGEFFDLMYTNIDNWNFNEHRQFAFIRKYENEVLLFVVNFDDRQVNTSVHIPEHAFTYLGIPAIEKYEATDLLTNTQEEIVLLPNKSVSTTIEKLSGKILKIVL